VPDEVLRLDGVCKSYDKGKPTENEVLHSIDLVLCKGEFAALIGPSGSGKSTLLNVVGLLDRPDGGKLYVEGRDTSQLDELALTKLRGQTIGFVFQYHYLLSALMPLLLEHGRPDDAMRAKAEALLDKVGLTPWRASLVNNLSGGQQQRVAVARALAMSPPLLLADEPTGNLDTKSADGVFDLMREVNRASGTAFLFVTHDPRLADRCERVIELVDGRIVSDGPRRG
jgi:lipoprotein-releasing system ATP-binding protein